MRFQAWSAFDKHQKPLLNLETVVKIFSSSSLLVEPELGLLVGLLWKKWHSVLELTYCCQFRLLEHLGYVSEEPEENEWNDQRDMICGRLGF